MLNDKDIRKITPYLADGTVVNMEVKKYIRKGKVIRNLILEYEDGRKMVGDLNTSPFKMTELKGMTSIASYFARGNTAVIHGAATAVVFSSKTCYSTTSPVCLAIWRSVRVHPSK